MTHLFKNILNTNLFTQAESWLLVKLFEIKNVNEVTVQLFTNPKSFYIVVH